MISYTISTSDEGNTTISLTINGENYIANEYHPAFKGIREAVLGGRFKEAVRLFDIEGSVVNAVSRNLSSSVSIQRGEVFLNGDRANLPSIEKKIISLFNSGKEVKPLVNFLEKLASNPQASSREQLYDYLNQHNYIITPEGNFLAYKGVNPNLTSVTAGPGIINGVETTGHLDNSVGNVLEFRRQDVDDNTHVGCSVGLHSGTYDYARNFGKVVVQVEIDPKDVVSVPRDSNCQKLRVCKYVVRDVVSKEVDEDEYTEENYDEGDWFYEGVEDEDFGERLSEALENFYEHTRHYTIKARVAADYTSLAERLGLVIDEDVLDYLDNGINTNSLYRYQIVSDLEEYVW